jgi:hypothetical protein
MLACWFRRCYPPPYFTAMYFVVESGGAVKQPSALVSMPSIVLGIVLLAGPAQTQPGPFGKASTPFPSQHTKDVKWLDSLAKGIEEASGAKKPICLILAGQRPSGEC